MRLSLVFCTAALVNTAFAAALLDLPVSATAGRRGLDGFFDGFQDQDQSTATAHDRTAAGSDSVPTPTLSSLDDSGLKSFLGFSSASTQPTSTKGKNKETTAVPTGTAYSVIGSLPPLHTPSAALSTIPPATSSSATTAPPTAAAASAASSTSSGASEWKIVGVAVIAFTTIAAILLLSVFFDQWWRFVRDSLICCRRKKDADEELVPDWEKAEWDLRCGPDRQRYPSFSSLPSIARVQPPPPAAPGPSRHHDFGSALGQDSGTVTGPGLAGYPQEAHRERTPSGVGLGLGRVGSVRSQRSAPGGGACGPSPSPKRSKTAYEAAMGNPFDDIHSPTPEDVYGGVVH